MDADAGPRINSANDFRIVYTRTYPDQDTFGEPLVTEIYMATVDVSEGTLSNFHQLTEVDPVDGEQLHPAWCGGDHVVWSRPYEGAGFYEREICIMEVDADGPVGDPVCYWGVEDGDDDMEDEYPSCTLDGSKIAWARGSGYGAHDIWVMDCDGTDCDTDSAENLMNDYYDYDDIHPTWSPSGTQIAFTSDRAKEQNSSDDDLDIWVMNASGSGKANRTHPYDDVDQDPDWGGAAFP